MLAAHTPWSAATSREYSIAVGAPARVVRDRMADYRAATAQRAALADIARKTAAAVQARLGATESM